MYKLYDPIEKKIVKITKAIEIEYFNDLRLMEKIFVLCLRLIENGHSPMKKFIVKNGSNDSSKDIAI